MKELRQYYFSCASELEEGERLSKAIIKLKEVGFKEEEIIVLVRNMALVYWLEKALKEQWLEYVLIKNIIMRGRKCDFFIYLLSMLC